MTNEPRSFDPHLDTPRLDKDDDFMRALYDAVMELVDQHIDDRLSDTDPHLLDTDIEGNRAILDDIKDRVLEQLIDDIHPA